MDSLANCSGHDPFAGSGGDSEGPGGGLVHLDVYMRNDANEDTLLASLDVGPTMTVAGLREMEFVLL